MTHLIIDADPIVYRCGFAAETPTYHLVMEDPVTGIYEAVFAPYDGKTAGARMQKWIQDHPDDQVLEKEKVVYPEPESHALEAVRTQLYSIEKECREHYAVDDFERVTVILSGPGNYREKLATIVPYKGNRDPAHKPYWYQAIRNYLTGTWGAVVVHGREADDECSIIGHNSEPGSYIIATIDKDLDQIPGNHYNYLKQVFYANSADDGERFFWQQVISGDATDGVPGCFRVGELRARRLADDVIGEARPADRRPNLWAAVVAAYARSKAIPGCPYVESSAEAVALETARLVYLQQQEGELWIPTGPPHARLEEYVDE
jgi:hypothetical protein